MSTYPKTTSETVTIDGRDYVVDVKRMKPKSAEATRILIPAWQPNLTARRLLEICIISIQDNTPEDEYELWVVDNCSGPDMAGWLMDLDNVNVVLSRTRPLPPEQRGILSRLAFWRQQKEWGSYSNAIGLELGLKFIPEETPLLLTLHMDTMMCRPDWLHVLKGRLSDEVRGSGVCFEKARTPEGVLGAGIVARQVLQVTQSIQHHGDRRDFRSLLAVPDRFRQVALFKVPGQVVQRDHVVRIENQHLAVQAHRTLRILFALEI